MKRNKAIREEYLAPGVKVVNFIEQGVLCGSITVDNALWNNGEGEQEL